MPRGRRDWFDRQTVDDAMRYAISLGLSDRKAGEHAGVSWRTVLRYRQRAGIPANIPQHGRHVNPNERRT